MRDKDCEEFGECCAVCTNWTRDPIDDKWGGGRSVYGQCSSLQILTEEDFYCSYFEDRCPPEEEKSSLEEELEKNPNWVRDHET